MKIDKDIKECPYCKHDEYFVKQSYKGVTEYNFRYDGTEAENGHMWDGANFKNISKYAWCSLCYRRLFKLEEE